MSRFLTRPRKPGLCLDVAYGCGFLLGWFFVAVAHTTVVVGTIALCVWVVVYVLQAMGVI